MNTNTDAPSAPGHGTAYAAGAATVVLAEEPVAWYLHHAAAAEKDDRKSVRAEAKGAYMRRFGERCKAARGLRDINDVADKLGLHRNTIYNIERGSALPDPFELEIIAKLYGTTAARLLEGEQQEQVLSTVEKSAQAVQVDGFVYVPLFDIRVSAGNGAFNDVESVIAMRPFDASFIRHDLGITHNNIAMSLVVGNSMEPWLHSKDTVLHDLNDRDVMTEGVHIVRLDGALLCKKLQRLPGKILRVSSYNEAYQSFDIEATEDIDRDFAVISRVRWGGITFN